MCFSAFSTTESSLCHRVRVVVVMVVVGRGVSGWALSDGAKWKDRKGRVKLSGRSHQVARV